VLLMKDGLNATGEAAPNALECFGEPARKSKYSRGVQALGLMLAEGAGVGLALAVASQFVPIGRLYDLSLLALSAGVFLFLQLKKSHYTKRKPFWDQLYGLLETCLLLALLTAAVPTFVGKSSSSIWLVWAIALVTVPVLRFGAVAVMSVLGVWQRPTVIVGDGANAVETAKALMQDKTLGYEVIGFLAAGQPKAPRIEIGRRAYPVAPLGGNPEATLKLLGYPHVIMALERGGLDRMKYYFDKLNLVYPRLSVVPALRGIPLFGMDVDSFFSHEVMMLNVRNNLCRPTSRLMKRVFDIVGSAVLLIVLAPVFAVLWFLVRKTGKQVIFGHERIGKNGKPFKCYKFRSMVMNANEVLEELLRNDPEAREEWHREFKLKNDPRITQVGHFLRKTSLDELPQLWNVLKGDMSLVGPRPVISEEIERYGEKSQHYLQAKPGMTGLWQVSGRNDIDYDSRVYLDTWYVKNWSLWSDIVILLRTVRVVLGRNGAY